MKIKVNQNSLFLFKLSNIINLSKYFSFHCKSFSKYLYRCCYSTLSQNNQMANISELDDQKVFKRALVDNCNNTVDDKKLKPDLGGSKDEFLNKVKRVKLKKFVMLLSYCGVGYFGLQKNNNVQTIEGELFNALEKSGMLLKEQCEKPQSVYFQRAARTDKGVSAIKQTLSCNLPVNFIEEIAKINEHLPNQIRLIAAKRATKNFDAKNYCDARTYAYMMPSYTLTLPDELTSEQFRINDERLKKFNLILNSFKGVHNFHNFTSQKSPTDVSAMRYIIDIECGQPFVKDNIEFVIVRVKGQSFMLHQIRKMIGLVIGIMRGFANIDIIEKCFLLDRIDIPKAPGLGLMLEEVHYDKYNYRYGGNGIHEKITWDEYHDTIEKFKHEFIYPVIVQTEGKELSMLKWLQRLPVHTFDVRQIDPSKNNELNDTNLEDMSKEELFNNINSKRTLYYGSYVNAGLFTSSSNKFIPGQELCDTSLSKNEKEKNETN